MIARAPEILFIGRDEMALDHLIAGSCRRLDSVDAALEHLSTSRTAPELIVLVQSRPGEFTTRAIGALRRAAPLARFERVAGSWCEGEQRSGQPPAGCVNHYWHQWPARFAHEHTRAVAGECPAWGLPPTMGNDERLLNGVANPVARGSGLVVICAERAAGAMALAEVCRLAGYTPHVVRADRDWHVAGACAVLWDAAGPAIADAESVERIRAAGENAPVVAVVGFPRSEECQAARDAGVSAIVSKPYAIRDLLAELVRVAPDTIDT